MSTMARKRARKVPALRPYKPPVDPEPVTVERAVSEGLLIARSAVTMMVKNDIIVGALRDGLAFDPRYVSMFVREELERLAAEEAGYAERVESIADKTAHVRGNPVHEHDYREADHDVLTQRHDVYSELAEELMRLRDDQVFVAGVVESARANAWAELSGMIESRLDWVAGPPSDEDYENQRDDRLRLLDADLKALARDARAARRQAKVPRPAG